ncbi:MAG TPA: 1,2-phenylacetyl-CoA epoxidase subunit PaaC [Actinomycetota bacterium]|nr:1,2-phenylacetyl-CoA epoxidase subunit PaaC [Actinomycetota bacterium]
MPDQDPRLALLLSVADDELILGHRHSEWTGWAPYLEEDLAFSSLGQDEIGHARLLYELAEPLAGKDPDTLALGRRPEEYRHAILCERPNRDWGYTIARQYLYDTADDVRLAALEDSSFAELAAAVKTIRLEERYHLDHARQWFSRLAAGPVQARQRFAEGLEAAMGEAMALFETLPGEKVLVDDGVLPASNEELLAEWLGRVGQQLEEATLDWVLTEHARAAGEMVPTSSGEIEEGPSLSVPGIERSDGKWVHVGEFAGAGGRRGKHTDDFTELWEEMTSLYRAVPGATW